MVSFLSSAFSFLPDLVSTKRERLSFETKRNGRKDVTENVEQPG